MSFHVASNDEVSVRWKILYALAGVFNESRGAERKPQLFRDIRGESSSSQNKKKVFSCSEQWLDNFLFEQASTPGLNLKEKFFNEYLLNQNEMLQRSKWLKRRRPKTNLPTANDKVHVPKLILFTQDAVVAPNARWNKNYWWREQCSADCLLLHKCLCEAVAFLQHVLWYMRAYICLLKY